MVTWHSVNLEASIAKSIKEGKVSFDEAREMVRGDKPKPSDAAMVLDGIRLALQNARS